MFDGVKIFLPPLPNRMLVFAFLVFKKTGSLFEGQFNPQQLSLFATLHNPCYRISHPFSRIEPKLRWNRRREAGQGQTQKKCLHDKISLQINMTMKVTTFSAVMLIFTRRPVFIHALTILPETKSQTFVKYLLPQITRRYPVKMYYKSVEHVSPFQQKKLNIGLTPWHPNGVW